MFIREIVYTMKMKNIIAGIVVCLVIFTSFTVAISQSKLTNNFEVNNEIVKNNYTDDIYCEHRISRNKR